MGQVTGRRLLLHRVRLPARRQRTLEARLFNPDFFLLREGSDEVVVVESRTTTTSPTRTAASSPTPRTTSPRSTSCSRRRRQSPLPASTSSPRRTTTTSSRACARETRWVRLDVSRRVERNAGRRLTRDRGRGTLEGLRASADTRRTEAPPPLTGAQESKNRAAHMVREVGRFHADRRSARLGLHVSPNQPCWERPVRRNWARSCV